MSASEAIQPLTTEVARKYLKHRMWTSPVACLVLSGFDPESRHFFDDDDAEVSNAWHIWHAIQSRTESDDHKGLPPQQWIDWFLGYFPTIELPVSLSEAINAKAEPIQSVDILAPTIAGFGATPDISRLATRKQLIDAFGAFTGMDIQWFNTIKDTPALLAARKVTGQGGRGHIAEPLFCPFEVLQWLIDTARRKGRPLGPAKGWELFEGHFPRAYAAFSVGDPRTD